MKISVIGCSSQGYSHRIHEPELPCQDAHLIKDIEDGVVLAVADGHGSPTCLYSDVGSRLSAETFCEVMAEYCERYKNSDGDYSQLYTFFHREGEWQVAQNIVKTWRAKVRKAFEDVRAIHDEREPGKYPPLEEDDIGNGCENCKEPDQLYGNEQDDWEKRKEIYHLYGTTLVGMLITPEFHFALQIGDGDISRINDDGQAEIFLEEDNILGVETYSLCEREPWKRAHAKLIHSSNDEFSYILSSDGFKNSHASQHDYLISCKEYVDAKRSCDEEKFKAALPDWLYETSEYGCGDDITVVIIDSYDPARRIAAEEQKDAAGEDTVSSEDEDQCTDLIVTNPDEKRLISISTRSVRMMDASSESNDTVLEKEKSDNAQASAECIPDQNTLNTAGQEPEEKDSPVPDEMADQRIPETIGCKEETQLISSDISEQ